MKVTHYWWQIWNHVFNYGNYGEDNYESIITSTFSNRLNQCALDIRQSSHCLDFEYRAHGICIREHQITAAIKSVDTQFPAKTRRRCRRRMSGKSAEKYRKMSTRSAGGVGEEAGQRNGRTLVPGALLSRPSWPRGRQRKKKLPIYKPLAENEV